MLRVESRGPGGLSLGGKAVDSAPVVGEGTMRVLNLAVCGLSWKVGVVGERLRGVFGVAGAGADDDDGVERRESIEIPIVDEAKVVVCATCEVGAKNAICEVGGTSCGLAATADVSEGASGEFVLDVEEGPSALVVDGARAVREGFDCGTSDWAGGTGLGYSSRGELGEALVGAVVGRSKGPLPNSLRGARIGSGSGKGDMPKRMIRDNTVTVMNIDMIL